MLVTLTDRPGEIVTRDELPNRIGATRRSSNSTRALAIACRQIRLARRRCRARRSTSRPSRGEAIGSSRRQSTSRGRDVTITAEAPSAPETHAAIASPREESRKAGTEGRRSALVAVAAAAIAIIGLAGAGWLAWSREATGPGLYTRVTNFTDAAVTRPSRPTAERSRSFVKPNRLTPSSARSMPSALRAGRASS